MKLRNIVILSLVMLGSNTVYANCELTSTSTTSAIISDYKGKNFWGERQYERRRVPALRVSSKSYTGYDFCGREYAQKFCKAKRPIQKGDTDKIYHARTNTYSVSSRWYCSKH